MDRWKKWLIGLVIILLVANGVLVSTIIRSDYKNAPSPAAITGEVTYDELLDFFEKELGHKRMYAVYIMDKKYSLTSVQELKRFLQWDETDKLFNSREPDILDCDDLTARLMGNITVKGWSGIPFGIIYDSKDPNNPESGIGHAYNFFVTKEYGQLTTYRVEPQNDGVFPLSLSETKQPMFINLP